MCSMFQKPEPGSQTFCRPPAPVCQMTDPHPQGSLLPLSSPNSLLPGIAWGHSSLGQGGIQGPEAPLGLAAHGVREWGV